MKTAFKNMVSSKFLILGDQALISGLSFLLTLIIARIFSPYDFGIYSAITIGLFFILNITNSIIIQPLQVKMASEKNPLNYIYFNLLLLLFIIGIGIISSYIIVLFYHNEVFNLSNYWGLVLYSASFLLYDFFRKIYLTLGSTKKLIISDLSYAVIALAYCSISYFYDLAFSVFIQFLGVMYLLPALYAVATLKKTRIKFSLMPGYFQYHLSQGKYLLMSAGVQWWSSNLFIVASGLFIGLEALGAFRLIQSLFGVLNVFLQTMENYFLPNLSRIYIASNEDALLYLNKLSIQSIVIFGSVLLGIFLLAEPLLLFFVGSAFIDYSYVVKGMAILYFIIIVSYPARMGIRVLLLNKDYLFGYVLSLVFSLISFNYLLSNFQLYGAILGLISSQLILFAFWYHRLTLNNFRLWKSFM